MNGNERMTMQHLAYLYCKMHFGAGYTELLPGNVVQFNLLQKIT
uniref:Uncharacterized protein n=1 Tax=Anguilla anguilla TaxID=7936 RepID=A0A0E9QIJ4_ANGAN